jgi:hypothetical protein
MRASGGAHNINNDTIANNVNHMGKVRYAQLQDMTNHEFCAKKNQKALMVEKINELSALVTEIQDTNWMFEKKGDYDGGDESRPASLNRGIDEKW